jgi:hypothetical protein
MMYSSKKKMRHVEMPRYLPIGMIGSGLILVPIIVAILFAPGAVNLLLFMAAIAILLVIVVSLVMQYADRTAPVAQPLPPMPDISTPTDTSWDRGFQRGERERLRHEAYDEAYNGYLDGYRTAMNVVHVPHQVEMQARHEAEERVREILGEE